MKVTEEGDTLRAVGDGTVTLSAYGIERPSQLGVTTADDVKLRFDLAGANFFHPRMLYRNVTTISNSWRLSAPARESNGTR